MDELPLIVRAAIKHYCYYQKSFRNWIQKLPLYTSSFGALIISNQQAPPQRELLLIDCYWEYECEWSTESFSWLKVEQTVLVITIKWSVYTYYCHVLERYAAQALHLLPWLNETEWNKQCLFMLLLSGVPAYCCLLERHTTQVLQHLLWLIESGTNSVCYYY